MKLVHKMNKDKLKLEKETLNAEIENMITSHRNLREQVENDAWDKMEQLKESQNQKLAAEVEKGMKQKAELTLIMTNFKKKTAEKKAAQEQLETKNQELNQKINECTTVESSLLIKRLIFMSVCRLSKIRKEEQRLKKEKLRNQKNSNLFWTIKSKS